MTLNEFIEKFAEALEVEDVDALTPQTKFRDIDEWSSIAALYVIEIAQDEYDKTLRAQQIREAETIEDLYRLMEND